MKPRSIAKPESFRDASADELAKRLHDELGQQLVGVTLETGALARKLNARNAPELPDVNCIVQHLRSATREVTRLIDWLDHGRPR
jgi:signal transduction histidine kinase